MGPVAKNFVAADFSCRCKVCLADPMSPLSEAKVIVAAQRLRDRLGEPVVISRGVSCVAHNAAIGGAPDSRHLPQHGDAIDVAHHGPEHAFRIVGAAIELNDFRVIRVYSHHVHLDMRPTQTRWFLASPDPQGGC